MNNRMATSYKEAKTNTDRFLIACGAVSLSFVAVLVLDYVARGFQ